MARRDPTVFERTAKGYGRVRPGYPNALFDYLLERTGLQAGAQALELGCGPGFVTEGLATRGIRVHAVDAARAMLDEARARIAGRGEVTYEQAVFEDWEGPAAPVDLVCGGMSWHWLDPDVRDTKIGPWLKPAGWLALLFNWPLEPWSEGQDLYARYFPNYVPPVTRSIEQRIETNREAFASHGVFELVDVGRWPQPRRYSASVYLEVLDTYSDHVVLPDDIKRPFYAAVRQRIEDLGGHIDRPVESVVLLAQLTR